VDARYTDRDTFTRTFFGGGNNGPATVNLTSTSPFYSNALATAVGLTPGAPIPIQYNLQAHLPAGFKFGNSTYDTQLSVTTGVDINLPADWHSEIAYTYANNDTCGFCYIDSFVSTDNADVNGVVFTPVIQRAINTGVINPLSSAPLTDSQFDFINGDNVQYAQSDSHDLTVRFDGPLIDLPGGKLRAAVGAEYQALNHALQNGANRPPINDFLWDANSNYDREVYSTFAEFYVPVIGKQMNVPLVQSLALNAAARYDKYSDFGETTNPRVGFTWRVYDDLSFRGSWGTSYRAPDISRLQSGVFSAALIGIPISYTPAVLPLVTPPGFTDLFFPGSGQVSGLQIIGGNSELRAEEGENTSFGFDFEPGFVPGLRLSGTYYKINYDNQLGAPPVNLFFANAQNATTYGDFYTVIQPNQPGCNPADPSTYDPRVRQALIDALYDINIVGNACGVNVILDGRTSNTAGRVQEGLDFQADYVIDTDFGRFDFSGNINRILTSEFKASAITPTVDDLGGENGVNGPIEWRGRAGVNWSSGGWSVNLFGNYVGEFTINDVFQLVGQPAAGPRRVDSFITGDLNVNYSFDQAGNTGALSGLRVSLNVNNFTDEDPPIALTNGGSVNPNHDALGRVVRVSLTKAF
jgi:iron complex outermembrane receptor protein